MLAVSPQDNDLAVLSRILSHSAWTLVTAACVAEARSLIEKTHFHVVLTDRRLNDGEEIHGWIEWYDKGCLKVNRDRGANLLIPKASIKYMYKEG